MTAENRRALLAIAADLRKIIRKGQSHEWQLRSMANTITEVVKEESKHETVQQTKA